jgi:uncharacterized protein HemX
MPARKRAHAEGSAVKDSSKTNYSSKFDEKPVELSKEPNSTKFKLIRRAKGKIIIVLVLLSLLALGAAAYSYGLYYKSQEQIQNLKANPQEIANAETKKTVDAVGKLITLPANETPTIATVTDAKKLKNQAFFSKAENGDKVLIYTQAKKAILYREKINKIIEVAPVNLGQSVSPTVSPKPRQATPTPQEDPTEAPEEPAKE